MNIEGHGLDFLVRGEVDSRWEKRISGHPYLVNNDVLRYLKPMMNRFTYPFTETLFYVHKGKDLVPYEDVALRHQNQPFFAGGLDTPLAFAPHSADIQALQNGDSKWNIELEPGSVLQPHPSAKVLEQDVPVDPNAFFFWRFADQSDFPAGPAYPLEQFYSFVTHDHLPRDFGIAILRYMGCGPSIDVDIYPKRLHLFVAMMGIHLTQVTTIGSVATHGRNGGRLSPDSCGTRISV
jgi:hypothetical protein